MNSEELRTLRDAREGFRKSLYAELDAAECRRGSAAWAAHRARADKWINYADRRFSAVERSLAAMRDAKDEKIEKIEADLSALKQRVAEVLEPFAGYCAADISEHWHDDNVLAATPARTVLRVGNFRRAAELHASLTQEAS